MHNKLLYMDVIIVNIHEWDPLTMCYFDNLDNESLNKYKKILKIKKFIEVFFRDHQNFMQFDSPSKTIRDHQNFMQFATILI
jgi:hypothetical protein